MSEGYSKKGDFFKENVNKTANGAVEAEQNIKMKRQNIKKN